MQAVEGKKWAAVGRLFKAPKHMTTMSHTFKKAYAKLLFPFEIVSPSISLGTALLLHCTSHAP